MIFHRVTMFPLVFGVTIASLGITLVAEAADVYGSNSTYVEIPDAGDWVSSTISISGAPADAVVTSIDVHFSALHDYSGDLDIDLNADPQGTLGNFDIWSREGGSANNPSRTEYGVTTFNGLTVNRTWYLYAKDYAAGDVGGIDEWWIRIYYTSTNEPPSPFSKNTPTDGTVVTSYTVEFDWESTSDPDGDSVTYNLEVNDENENPVAGCKVDGLSSSSHTCTLPQQPDKDYYWQVWAIDSQNNDQEATGPFWHIKTDSQTNEPPSPFSKNTPTDGTVVTSYTVEFDWESTSDPDGDSVTYNLEVNDENENPVAGCKVDGLSSSSHTCTLPQQPDKDYYWQVWAIDSQNNDQEATGPFWHIKTDSDSQTNEPQQIWQRAVKDNPDALITQCHGAIGEYCPGSTGYSANKTHGGVDISLEGGIEDCSTLSVYPIAPGEVLNSPVEAQAYLGNYVIIRHHDGLYSLYAHLADGAWTAEGFIDSNQSIGFACDTGTLAKHLHLEIRRFEDPVYMGDFYIDEERTEFRWNDGDTCPWGNTNIRNTYQCGDVRNDAYFIENWINPDIPAAVVENPFIGQFNFESNEQADALGFIETSGDYDLARWDTSSNQFSNIVLQAFTNADQRLRTPEPDKPEKELKKLGTVHDNGGGIYVHCWSAPGQNPDCANGVWIQDLRRLEQSYQLEPDGISSLILNPGMLSAFLLKEGFWGYYSNHDGFQNLGAPTTRELPYNDTPTMQQFENGALYYSTDLSEDRTPPTSDGITVLNTDLVTPISATQGWHVVGQEGEPINLYQNGNYLCQTPCTEIYSVDGWRYTITAPDVELLGASILPGPGAAPPNAVGLLDSPPDPQVLLNDLNNFSFTADLSGGTVVLKLRPPTERVSVDSNGNEGNSSSSKPSISGNGSYVAFESGASNLVEGDSNLVDDVFVRDRMNNTTVRVSISSGGAQGNDDSRDPSIDSSGRYVAFESRATNLVPGDTNDEMDIFVHDRQTETAERVSVASDGTEGDMDSYDPSISADGRYVVFRSKSRDLTTPGGGGVHDNVIMHDRQTGETTLISISLSGTSGGNNYSSYPVVSGDGNFVVFESEASNLVPDDITGTVDVLLRDVQSGTTQRINVSSQGEAGDESAKKPTISSDGEYIAYYSRASNLVEGDTNGDYDIFVYDRQTSTTERVSVASDGTEANGNSYLPSISTNGRYVTFESDADNLVEGDDGESDIFLHDRQMGTTIKISMTSNCGLANGSSADPSINSDGRFVVFKSLANNLVDEDTNAVGDIFVRNRANCTIGTYTIGGSVNGLIGTGLVLQNNTEDDLGVAAEGSFAFTTPLDDGSPYAVTVLTQPSDPNQTCVVTNGNGTVAGANVTDVSVSCITITDQIFSDSFE